MNLDKLLEYQAEDLKLRKIEEEVKASEEYKKYAQASRFMRGAQEKLDALERRTGELKALLDDLNRRDEEITGEIAEYNDLEDMIEGGGDIGYYERSVRALADRLRAVKAELNKLMGEIKAAGEEYKSFRQQTIAMQKQGKEFKEKYEALRATRAGEFGAIKKTLDTIAKDIPAPILEQYAAKSKEKIFPIFVPLTGGGCVCGMSFSLAQQSTLSGGKMIECEHCRRLVYNK